MLRPKRMSKVSVTGARSYMPTVIEAVHDLGLVHLSDYDGSWAGFDNGTPIEGAENASQKLVTIRSLENTLGLDEDPDVPEADIDESEIDERLEDARTDVNELDDRRAELRERRRELEERIDRLEPFERLGIDLDLLSGYDSIEVAVGEGDPDELRAALEDAQEVRAFEVEHNDGVAGLFVAPAEGEAEPISDALVGVEFTRFEIPEGDGDPDDEITRLRNEVEKIESDLESVESELESAKREHGGFLLAAERHLTIEVNRAEAPLQFATTDRSFIAEGWIPTEQYDDLVDALETAVGDHVEIEELERAAYDEHGDHSTHDDEAEDAVETDESTGPSATDDGESQQPAATDGGQPVVETDGGAVTMDDEPPVVQQNSTIVNPFEVLVSAVNRPKYSEFDPTVILFVTFPIFFGFMIGDVAYGAIYAGLGWWMYSKFDAESYSNVGAVLAWMGIWTIVFGVLYGEILGLHFFDWFGAHPPIEKGINDTEWALAWLVVAVLAGWFHLNLGYIMEFVEEYQLHGPKPALTEVGSWLLMLNGIWLFVFSKIGAGEGGAKPPFLVGPEAALNGHPIPLGFSGLPEFVGLFGVLLTVLGLLLLLVGPWYEIFEFVVPLSHVLSYTRLTAVLLAKAGMALAANLLYWGAYQDEEGFHFIHTSTPEKKEAGKEVLFGGFANMGSIVEIGPLEVGLVGLLLGLPVYLIAHAVVLAVGGTAAIQAVRLEYFEFFEKFYEGGGKKYEPFGSERTNQ